MQELYAQGRIVQTKPGSVPAYKRYLDEMPGTPLQDVWDNILPLGAQAAERLGYPTQKPLTLLGDHSNSGSGSHENAGPFTIVTMEKET
jgi:hypothetical protein